MKFLCSVSIDFCSACCDDRSCKEMVAGSSEKV